ncbi:butyrate kinase [Bifidobacterium margollesii]|uniref:Probable butyrate kinase n=1 Tax=Bifidobacterium margollesii TaxID=2020964 RepID=A0A2N5JC21_9BIFI|nr:butyrate kinase [Bifidobacterium margollesii]PLS31756.1 butyrate kinase [Bifidobacterium margollesii]
MTATPVILTLSPGSTSTKIAVFKGEEVLFKANVQHPANELAAFDNAIDQFDYRRKTILDELATHDMSLDDIDAFSGYCGSMGPTVGGIFAIDETVCEHVTHTGVNHPAILGAPLLYDFAKATGKPAYAVNQPDTDELIDVARITGYPGVYRKSHVHCLNQKEVAIRYAKSLGRDYEDINVIVAHIGGGLSVAAHEHGRMIDTNDVLEGSGPFAPNRSGDVPLKPVVRLCFDGEHDQRSVLNVVGKTGGLMGLVGTDDAREIGRRIEAGDEWARIVYDAMGYQVAKAIGGFAATLKGRVDGIILTGGVSNDKTFVAKIVDRVGWIAPVQAYGGDFEMEALAAGAVRAIAGTEAVMTYTGEPSWAGFTQEGAIPDIG